MTGGDHQVCADQTAATERFVAPQELTDALTGLQPGPGPALGPGQQGHPGVVVPLGVHPAHHLPRGSPHPTGGVVVEGRGGRTGHCLAMTVVVRATVASPLTPGVTVTAQAGSSTLPLAATNVLRLPRRRRRRRRGRGRGGRGGGEKTTVSIILTTISYLETI